MNNMAAMIQGWSVYTDEISTVASWKSVEFRFPKSKKRRIRKKWSSRSENSRQVPDEYRCIVSQTERKIVVHPDCLDELADQFKTQYTEYPY